MFIRNVPGMSSLSSLAATRLTTAELAWLLSLRPGASATLVATAFGLPPAGVGPLEEPLLEDLLAAGRAQERRGELLPRGESAVIGDVLTSALALISVGTKNGLAAVLAVGRDRVLLVAPAGQAGVEVAALDASTTPGTAAAALAGRLGPDLLVMVAIPGGDITEAPAGADLAERIDGLLP